MYGSVNGVLWSDRPVAIVAGGPSLRGFDWERLRDFRVLAVKGAIFDIPWADAGFGLDLPRFEEWRARLAAVAMTVYWAVPEPREAQIAPPPANVIFVRRLEGDGVSDDPGAVYSGGTGGFGALQIALLKRSKHILLMGYDYDGAYTGIHSHGAIQQRRAVDQHYGRRRIQSAANWAGWASNFDRFNGHLNGCEVINACPNSSISAFTRMDQNSAIDLMRQH